MNYYEILKISKDADEGEIKKAYKDLVKKYHPDLYLADKEFAEKRIKEINEAYRILIGKESRLEYDEYLNEISQETTQNIINETVYQKKEEYSQGPIQEKFSITYWLFKKFDSLKRETQIKFFLVLLFIIIVIFFNNILKFKKTFEKPKNIIENSVKEDNSTFQMDNHNNLDEKKDYKDNYDYYYNEELQKQFNEFYNSLIDEYRNAIVGQ